MPAAKLTTHIAPVERRSRSARASGAAVSSAENNVGSSSGWLLVAHRRMNYTLDHGQKAPGEICKTPPGEAFKSAPAGASRRIPARKPPRAARRWSEAEIREAFTRFRKANPEPKGELEHLNTFTLLVAVVMSAQATDAGVNKATRALFPRRRHAGEDGRARRGEAARLYQDRRALSHQGEERHRAVAAADRRAWRRRCRAVARRCRRCPASGARPPMSCSTSPSASRPSRSTRICSASATAPASRRARTRSRSRLELERVIPDEFKRHAHHWLILHGRYTCVARRPLCETCLINDLCRWPEKYTLASSRAGVNGSARSAAR